MLWKILFLSLVAVAWSLPVFQLLIPNGMKVPNPCDGHSGTIWNGVGHNQAPGAGPNNQFGLDFNMTGKAWTKDLCEKDSDQDGRTNGEELGDKDCVWKQGDDPGSDAIGHPGICEPMSDDKCKTVNQNIDCTKLRQHFASSQRLKV